MSQYSDHLYHDDESMSVLFDCGTSDTSRGIRSGFVNGTLTNLSKPIAIDKIGGNLIATHKEQSRY